MSYNPWPPVIALLLACDAGPEPIHRGDAPDGGKSDGVVVGGEYYDTRDAGAKLLETWHALHDEVQPTCLVVDETAPVTTSGSDIQGVHMFVSSREELARELGVSLSAEGTIHGVGAKASSSLLRKFSSSRRTRTFFLKSRISFDAESGDAIDLKPDKAALLEDGRAGIRDFVRQCGTHYIAGVRHAAELYLMITYTAATEEAADEFEAALEVDPGKKIPGADVSAELQTKLTSMARREDIEARIDLHATGFTFEGTEVSPESVTSLIGSEVNAEAFENISKILLAMGISATKDKANVVTPHASSATKTIAVAPQRYENLPSWPGAVNLDEVDEAILRNTAYLSALEQLMERIGDVYWDEIAPFREDEVDDHDRAAYNVAVGRKARVLRDDPRPDCTLPDDLYSGDCTEPGVPSSIDDIKVINAFWHRQFYPGDPATSEQVGKAFEALKSRYETCFLDTQHEPFHTCGTLDSLSQDVAWRQAEELLTLYHETGRLLPLRYWASDDAQTVPGNWTFGKGALGVCQHNIFHINGDEVAGDLPSLDEARYLAPLIGWGDIDWSDSSIPRAIWYQESEEACGPTEAGVLVRPRNAAEEPAVQCVEVGDWDAWNPWAEEIVALCIPTSGAIAEPPAP